MSARNQGLPFAAQRGSHGELPQPDVLEPSLAKGLLGVSLPALYGDMRGAHHSLSRPRQLPPHPVTIEEPLVAQHNYIEALLVDNRTLAATHASLKQELEVTRQQHAEKDLQMRGKSVRMENELRAMRSELLQAHKHIKDLAAHIHMMTQDLQQATTNKAEIEGLKAELERVRADIEYEKKGYAECFRHGKEMENKVTTMAQEMEKLQAELASAENRADVNNDKEKNLLEIDLTMQPLVGCPKAGVSSVGNLTEVGASNCKKKKRRKRAKKKARIKDEIQNMDRIEIDIGSAKNLVERDVNGKRKKKSCDVEMASHLSSPDMKEAESLSNDAFGKKKLLVLDVNGLLADVRKVPLPRCGEGYQLKVRKRPFCDDFLKFCLENFDVGVWSSRSKKNLDEAVDELFGDLKDKLLFCWDGSHCVESEYRTVGNSKKPIFFKVLSKIWENDDPDLPWRKGDYEKSNTLLLDDSPHEALLNPLHTAVFPKSYNYNVDENDNSLGAGGDIRVYLEGLVRSENVQEYVKQHQFGQKPIDENDDPWDYYNMIKRKRRVSRES